MIEIEEDHYRITGILGHCRGQFMENSSKIHVHFMENSWKRFCHFQEFMENSWKFMETDSGEVDGNQWICVQASADLVRRGYRVAGDTAENRSEVGCGT